MIRSQDIKKTKVNQKQLTRELEVSMSLETLRWQSATEDRLVSNEMIFPLCKLLLIGVTAVTHMDQWKATTLPLEGAWMTRESSIANQQLFPSPPGGNNSRRQEIHLELCHGKEQTLLQVKTIYLTKQIFFLLYEIGEIA